MKKKSLYLLLFLIITIFVVLFFQNNYEEQGFQKIKIGGEVIKVEVVDTPSTRAQGLSGRDSLEKDQAMLFVFDTPGNYSFWMKDMNFSIDIIWIDETGKIVYIKENATPESYPEGFGPNEKTSKYVLEVFSGFVDSYDLEVGDSVNLLY
jgi:uncharacterized membrane protein (UPF0127 family)